MVAQPMLHKYNKRIEFGRIVVLQLAHHLNTLAYYYYLLNQEVRELCRLASVCKTVVNYKRFRRFL